MLVVETMVPVVCRALDRQRGLDLVAIYSEPADGITLVGRAGGNGRSDMDAFLRRNPKKSTPRSKLQKVRWQCPPNGRGRSWDDRRKISPSTHRILLGAAKVSMARDVGASERSRGNAMQLFNEDVKLNVSDSLVGHTALVFLHHWGGSSQTWNSVISRLSDRFRCIAVDARGAGESDAPSRGYSAEDHASDALAVVRCLGLSRYLMVGHSMGGKTSQVLAAKRPKGLLGVALIASSPPSPMAIDEVQREQMRVAYADRAAIEWSLDNVLLGSPISVEARQQLIVDAQRLSPQAKSGWIDVGTREDFSSAVANIDVPVVIVSGELDRVDPLPVVKAHILPHYPSAKVEFLRGKGHMLPVEAADEIAKIVGDFAASI